MLSYWLVSLIAFAGIGTVALAVPSSRRHMKKWALRVGKWNASKTRAAVKATRVGKWRAARKAARAQRPPRLIVGRRRPEGTPNVARRVRQTWPGVRDRVTERFVGPNHSQRVTSTAAPTTESASYGYLCEAPTRWGGRGQCQRPVANPEETCFDHPNQKAHSTA